MNRKEFFQTLYKNINTKEAPYIEIRGARQGEKKIVDRQWFNDYENLANHVDKKMYKNINYWFGVATRRKGGGKKTDITRIPALWTDVDFKNVDKKEVIEKIKNFKLKPTIIVQSGNGFHIYWRLKKAVNKSAIKFIESYNIRILEYFNGDHNAWDATRVLRIPNTFNYKYEPSREVKVIYLNDKNEYIVTDFDFLPKPTKQNIEHEWAADGFISNLYDNSPYGEGNRNDKVVEVSKYYSNLIPRGDVLLHVWRFVCDCITKTGDGQYEFEDIKKRVQWALEGSILREPQIVRQNGDGDMSLVRMWIPTALVKRFEQEEV